MFNQIQEFINRKATSENAPVLHWAVEMVEALKDIRDNNKEGITRNLAHNYIEYLNTYIIN